MWYNISISPLGGRLIVFSQLYCTINREEIFCFGNKKCRIYTVFSVSQTPNKVIAKRGENMHINMLNEATPIKPYLYNGYLEAILFQHKDYKEWLYSNYIQLVYYNEYDRSIYLDYEVPTIYGGCPLLRYSKVEIKEKNEFFYYIKELIKDGKYIYIFLDEYYVPTRLAYHKEHYIHDQLIYGIDEEKEIFIIIGYDENHNFVTSEISFEECYQGYMQTDDNWYLAFLTMTDEEYKMDINKIKIMFEDYLYSRNSKEHWEQYMDLSDYRSEFYDTRNNVDSSYGIGIYEALTKGIYHCMEEDIEIDYRIAYLICEHHSLMKDRILYYIDKKILPNDKDLISAIDDLIDMTKQMMHACFKSIYAKDRMSIYKRLITNIQSIKEKDQMIVSTILERLGA